MNRPLHKRLPGAALPLLAVAAMVAAGFAGVRQTLAAGGYDGHTVLINELCAKNLTGLTTAAGTAEDWVELLNVSGRDIDLSGWGLSDDPDRPYKWTFPAGTTLSGGENNILVLFADGTGAQDADGTLHLGFRLGRTGETLILTDAQGNTVDSLDYPAQQYDLTYGRLRGSADRVGILANPTPGTANATRFWEETVEAADLGTVEFSVQAGFYSDTVTLELTCGDPDAAIVYTTDGSRPTTSSELYTGPITIASREGDANRYVSLAASYQGEWVSAYAYDYAPDPVDKATTITARVYKNGVLGQAVTARTYWVGVEPYTLPVVSVTAAADDLFGAEGIYMPGTTYYTMRKYGSMDITGNFLSNEKIDARIQILDAGGSLLLDADTTVRVSGGWSRQSAQMKNLHLKLQDGAVSGILSAAPGGDALDTLVLRGSGNGGAYTGLHQDAFLNNYLYSLDVGCQYNQLPRHYPRRDRPAGKGRLWPGGGRAGRHHRGGHGLGGGERGCGRVHPLYHRPDVCLQFRRPVQRREQFHFVEKRRDGCGQPLRRRALAVSAQRSGHHADRRGGGPVRAAAYRGLLLCSAGDRALVLGGVQPVPEAVAERRFPRPLCRGVCPGNEHRLCAGKHRRRL